MFRFVVFQSYVFPAAHLAIHSRWPLAAADLPAVPVGVIAVGSHQMNGQTSKINVLGTTWWQRAPQGAGWEQYLLCADWSPGSAQKSGPVPSVLAEDTIVVCFLLPCPTGGYWSSNRPAEMSSHKWFCQARQDPSGFAVWTRLADFVPGGLETTPMYLVTETQD